jgi:trk system potassium uptake protein TrkH
VRQRVDWRASTSLIGTVVKYLALAMLVPLFVAVIYREDIWVFVASILLTVTIGMVLERLDPDPDIGPREALLIVSASWLAASLVGTFPYLLAGPARSRPSPIRSTRCSSPRAASPRPAPR